MVLLDPFTVKTSPPDPHTDYQRQVFRQFVNSVGWHAENVFVGSEEFTRESGGSWVDSCGEAWKVVPADPASPLTGPSVRSKALMDWLHDDPPDVIVTRAPGTQIATTLCKGPWLFAIHVGFSMQGLGYRKLLDCDIALVETPLQRHKLVNTLGQSRVILLPKRLPDLFHPGPSSHEFDVVMISRFVDYKNFQALDSVVESGLRVALIGRGELLDEFRQRWADRANVQFFGQIPSTAVADVLRMSKVLVHPSLVEGLPRVVVEAMATGLPVVVLGSVIEWPVVDGVNGRRVREPELLDAVQEVLRPDRYEAMSVAALETYRREFSGEVFDGAVAQFVTEVNSTLDSGTMPRTTRARKVRITLDSVAPRTLALRARGKVRQLVKRLVRR